VRLLSEAQSMTRLQGPGEWAKDRLLHLLSHTSRYDNMIRTQISVDKDLYLRAKEVARRRGISLAELCRRSLEEVVAREPTKKPWMVYAGILEGRGEDSSSVDSVVYDREAP
jgi:hypothetical protein